MKKYYMLFMMICALGTVLTGCQGNNKVQAQSTGSAAGQELAVTGQTDNLSQNIETGQGGNIDAGKDSGVDVDLTVLSSTMVYGEVFNITQNPDEYLGKKIKAGGQYMSSYYDVTDMTYHYVQIADAAACCQQGLEFIWNGDHNYPDDYPVIGTDIEVIGTYASYVELDITYYYLAVDEIVVK